MVASVALIAQQHLVLVHALVAELAARAQHGLAPADGAGEDLEAQKQLRG